jgi:hypothetical protein
LKEKSQKCSDLIVEVWPLEELVLAHRDLKKIKNPFLTLQFCETLWFDKSLKKELKKIEIFNSTGAEIIIQARTTSRQKSEISQ